MCDLFSALVAHCVEQNGFFFCLPLGSSLPQLSHDAMSFVRSSVVLSVSARRFSVIDEKNLALIRSMVWTECPV